MTPVEPAVGTIGMDEDAHLLSAGELAARLQVDVARGLSEDEAARRRLQHGDNTLPRELPASPLTLLLRQFTGVMQLALLGACGLSAWLGDVVDAIAIAAILLLNGLLGFVQELRAERALAALRRLATPWAKVRRDGRVTSVSAASVVPGDVILLEAGDIPAADARLVESSSLQAVEASLTGEAAPVAKDALHQGARGDALGDRRGMVFAGTHVATGTATAIVCAIGAHTELGRIAALLSAPTPRISPLQVRLERLGRQLLALCLVSIAVVVAVGFARAVPWHELLMTAISLAVASIPEGLPAVVTIALALGVQAMARRGAIVRRLACVETLGSAQVICTDKTGTLTSGQMAVRQLVDAGDPRALLEALVACNDAWLSSDPVTATAPVAGDPMELALLAYALERGVAREELERAWPRVRVEPFDSETRRMLVVRQCAGVERAWLKGAPEVVLSACGAPAGWSERARAMAQGGLRVLGCAAGSSDGGPLTFLGLVGLADPPRAGAARSVARCRSAGILPVMITGDHPDTALAIAREVGIAQPGDVALTGAQLAALSDEELRAQVPKVTVFARVTATDKLRIVRAWRALGRVVAMTGDGVNDAPALQEASIGVAMGRTGTEVTKAAADIVLTDDDFSTLVLAVEQGRTLFEDIRNAVAYLLTANVAELAVMLAAIAFGLPVPLSALQLLWMNLVTDGLPALGLVSEPPAPGALTRPPHRGEIIDRALVRLLALGAVSLASVSLLVYSFALQGGGIAVARGMLFDTLVFGQLLLTFTLRSRDALLWELSAAGNFKLLLIVLGTAGLQLGLHLVAPARELLQLVALSPIQLALVLGGALVPVVVLEADKLLRRALAR